MVCPLQTLPRLTSQCPAGVRWAAAPASLPLGQLLGGRARPAGLHSCLLCHCPGSWAREQLQQAAVRLCKMLDTFGSPGTGGIPSGNEGRVPSELDKGCSGAGSNRHLTSLNFPAIFSKDVCCALIFYKCMLWPATVLLTQYVLREILVVSEGVNE